MGSSSSENSPIQSLGGYIPIRNNFRLGYCVFEGIESLLKICSEVIVADSDSTDGTLEALQRLADKDSRVKIVNFPWTDPKGVGADFLVEWLNFARSKLTTLHQITLDADEILDDSPECHQAIREACNSENPARQALRLNYWKDPYHLIPVGNCCSHSVSRLGYARMRMPSDQGTKHGEFEINEVSVQDHRIKIHHVGFLRRPDLFYEKSKVVQKIWINGYDDRLVKSELDGKPQWDIENCDWTNRLDKNRHEIPDMVQKWMIQHGHDTPKYLARRMEKQKMGISVVPPPSADGEPINILHSGDFGDIIYGMSVFRKLGKVRMFFHDTNWICKRILDRLDTIRPLLEAQDYIVEVGPYENQEIHWDAFEFRACHRDDKTLAQAHYDHYLSKGLPEVDWNPSDRWLSVIPDTRTNGCVLVNRTCRYRNEKFPWRKIVRHYGDRIRFVGDSTEYDDFCGMTGFRVQRIECENLLDVAKLVAGCSLFIGNQSAPMALAVALGVPAIQEVYPGRPDCVFPRNNITYVAYGEVVLPNIAGSGSIKAVGNDEITMDMVDTSVVPRGGWQYPDLPSLNSFNGQKGLVMRLEKCDPAKAEQLLFQYNLDRCPEFFIPEDRGVVHHAFNSAFYNAFQKQPEYPQSK